MWIAFQCPFRFSAWLLIQLWKVCSYLFNVPSVSQQRERERERPLQSDWRNLSGGRLDEIEVTFGAGSRIFHIYQSKFIIRCSLNRETRDWILYCLYCILYCILNILLFTVHYSVFNLNRNLTFGLTIDNELEIAGKVFSSWNIFSCSEKSGCGDIAAS